MIFHDIKQGSDEWFNLRQGKFTSSNFKDLFMGKSTAGYEKAIYKVAFERLTNSKVESEYQSAYMKRGLELEPEAIEKYSLATFNKVDNGGFCELDEWIGASPDGLIGTEGLLQIKAPAYHTMLKYMMKKELPNEYYYQVHGEMLVTGRKWNDFMAFHPALKPLIIRINRDEKICKEIHKKIKECVLEVKDILKELQK